MNVGDRILWFKRPARSEGRRTGTIVLARHSPRTAWEWVVECDGDGHREVVTKKNKPRLLTEDEDK